VCTGAFILGASGLLDGRRAVTHWASCDRLAERYPKATVDPGPIFVRDGDVWTSAGVTAGMDLALAMTEEDHGPDVSRAIARQLVMFVQRPGGQTQFSAQLAAQRPERAPLREVLDWIADHPDGDLSVSALAARAAMSERNFARVFRAETGRTPAAYVESARVEAARRLLETTATTLDSVARTCGFGTAETLHRSFKRTVQVTPGEYRRRFSSRDAAV
jgi:transcriptional regulator GlxA family with amidase domain